MKRRYIILGDAMIDRTYSGAITRISPEAPVPILSVIESRDTLGGAGNVAVNVASLAREGGGVSLLTVGSIDGQLGHEAYEDLRVTVRRPLYLETARPMPVKSRLKASGQQVYRFDIEDPSPITVDEEGALLELFSVELEIGAAAVIIADYRKGICTPTLVRDAISEAKARGVPVFVDTKPEAVAFYKGVHLLKLNRDEASRYLGCPIDKDNEWAAKNIRISIAAQHVVITLAGDGMLYAGPRGVGHVPACPGPVVDVTGAGDTVLAALAVGMTGKGLDIKEACAFAAQCAADVVSKEGTVAVTKEWVAQ